MPLNVTQQIKDFDIYDTILPGGRPYIQYGDRAISNEITFWITSSRGDYVRNPDFGGDFQELLYKPLLTLPKASLNRFKQLIEDNFGALLTVENFAIEPDIETNTWAVTLQWTSKLTKQTNDTTVIVNNTTSPTATITTYIDVTATGENLYNLVLLKLPALSNYKLEYSDAELSYIWGNLKLSNLTTSDPYFNAIELAINGV